MNLIKQLIPIVLLATLLTFPVYRSGTVSAQDIYWPTQEWHTSSPEAQGLDSGTLAQMLTAVMDQGAGIHSVLVIRHGTIVLEAYGYPYQPDTLQNTQAASATVLSALVGSAVQQGYITSVDQAVLDFFPEHTFANLDDAKRAMTLEDILTMRAGLSLSKSEEDMWQSPDLVQAILDQPLSSAPGTDFVYNGMVSNLLGLIVSAATGQNTLDFAAHRLFEPLGIQNFRWEQPAPGIVDGDLGLWLTPRDMAKIGYLYTTDGVWDGVQIFSPGWVAASTTSYITDPTTAIGGLPEQIADGYGFLWMLSNQGFFMASTFGGQAILVHPDLDLIAIFTFGGNAGTTAGDYAKGMVETFVLPAVQSPDPLPENPEKQAELADAILALAAPPEPAPVPALPANIQDISNHVYSLEDNSNGWSSLELRFEPDQAQAALILDGETYQVGLDGVFRVNTNADIPWLLKGEWVTDTAFQMELEQLGSPYSSEWLLRFDGSSVSVRTKSVEYYESTIERFNGSAQP